MFGGTPLPKRTTGNYLKFCKRQLIKTNLYKVDYSDRLSITIYRLLTQPSLMSNSQKLTKLVDSANNLIKQQIGNYIMHWNNVYACNQTKFKLKQCPIKIQSTLQNTKYVITIQPIRTINLSQLNSSKPQQTILPLNFFNNIIKKLLTSLKYVYIGYSGKYFNPKSKKQLKNSNLIIFNGNQIKFNQLQKGLYLRVQSMMRIVQNNTILHQINLIYQKSKQFNKQQIRNIVKKQLIGKKIMTNYGSSHIWIIKDILFDFDFQTNKISESCSLNFIQYYYKVYGLTIRYKKQPAIRAILNGHKNTNTTQHSILIPELMLFSGLPQNYDQRNKRAISQHTIISPQQKFHQIQNLINTFHNQTQNLIFENIGIKIASLPETVQAIMLPPPIIQLGNGQTIEKQKVNNFQLFSKQIYSNDIPLYVNVIIPHDYDFLGVQKLFTSTSNNLKLKCSLNIVKLNFQDSKKAYTEIQKYIEDKDRKQNLYKLNWFIIPPYLRSLYKTIKKLSLNSQNPKLTQITLTTTLAKKGFTSILTKILIQISSKIGNIPWLPKMPSLLNNKTILIGIDICKDIINKKLNVVGYCCTINKQMSKFHSNYHYQSTSLNFSTKIRSIIADCLTTYVKTNSYPPSQIIILKKDISDGDKDFIVNNQINSIKQVINEIKGYLPKITYVSVNTNSHQKFFLSGKTDINPNSGTLINNKIVSKYYDFYLISQQCNRGTVKPIHYKILYTDSKMQQGILQQLLYFQSFNYVNWSGSIRIPSVLQYASKLSNFISEHISHEPKTQQLNENLYFI